MAIKVICAFLLSLISLGNCSHFYGGSISGKYVSDLGSTISMEFQVRFGYRRNYVTPLCDDNVIKIGNVYLGSGSALACASNCVNSTVGSLTAYCIGYSVADNWAYSEVLLNVPVVKNASYVEATYASGAWIPLNNPNSSSGNWEVRLRLDTNYRTDINSYNTCPLTVVPPVIKMRLGLQQGFKIPYSDLNSDNVRCRYALAAKNECASICTPVAGVTINQTTCYLSFDTSQATIGTASGWYAIPLMIEDFKASNPTTPMCGVPLQFMIQVQNVSSSCLVAPLIVGDWPVGSCIAANINQQLNLRVVAEVGCAGNSMYSIQILGPTGLFTTSAVAVSGSTTQWSSNFTWTPKSSQSGPNLVCALATDKTYLISEMSCYTIVAGAKIPQILPGSGSPSGILTTAQLAGNAGIISWSVKFNIDPILKPVKPRYARLFYANGTSVFGFDVSTSSNVTFLNDTMIIKTGNNFVNTSSYYWGFDYGVGNGPEYCHPETDIIMDPFFWQFALPGASIPTTQSPVTSNQPPTSSQTTNPTITQKSSSVSNPVLLPSLIIIVTVISIIKQFI